MDNSDIRILVVDDAPDILYATVLVLRKEGFDVITSDTGAQCLERVDKDRPDLILLDVELPDILGTEVCKNLKNNPDYHKTYIMLASGRRILSEDQADGLDSGADGYITRPLSNREFLSRVNSMVRLIRAERKTESTIQELIKLEEKLKHMASTDELTGLANRRSFQDHFEWALSNMRRNKEALSIAMIDIDHFKNINDAYGHQTGDSVLIAVSSAIKQASRDNDYAARWGGEEFIVLLHGAGAEQSLSAAQRIRRQIAQINLVAEQITASIGVSTLLHTTADESKRSLDQLISTADKALYAAKTSGRNCVVHSRDIQSCRN